MTAAALVSTGFFAAPVVFSDRGHAALPIAAAPAPQRVELVATDVVAAVTTPELRLPARPVRVAAATRSRPPAQRTSVKLAQVKPQQNVLSRRVARLIAGDGRYAVRPFPTVELAQR
jgi:hypothetical protein